MLKKEGCFRRTATRGGQRYHYYTSEKRLRDASQEPEGLRVPAADLEGLVTKAIASKLTNDQWLIENVNSIPTMVPKLIQVAKSLADAMLEKNLVDTQSFRKLIERVIVEKLRVTISLNKKELNQRLNRIENHATVTESEAESPSSGASENNPQIIVQSHLLRCGKQMKLILGTNASDRKAPNPQLLNLIVQAKQWFAGLSIGKYESLSEIAKRLSLDKSYFSPVITLAFLALDILEKIITGDHSHLLTPERLRKACPLPLRWEDQRALLQV